MSVPWIYILLHRDRGEHPTVLNFFLRSSRSDNHGFLEGF